MRIYVQLPDGKKVYYTFDVTDQVRHASDPRNVHIVLDGLTLPKPLANGSGFRPTVDDWQEVEEQKDLASPVIPERRSPIRRPVCP